MNKESKNIYFFIGVGGVGMSALASLCLDNGYQVYGYDKTSSEVTQKLIQKGIEIKYDSSIKALPKKLLSKDVEVIYSSAISQSHPQLAYYLKQGNKVSKRAEFLSEICNNKKTLAVAGTHGKTTTLSFLTHIYLATKQSFTSIMGGFFNNDLTNLVNTGSDTFIVEADEYDRSFLQLYPSLACITSLEPDHLDIYGTEDNFIKAFLQFSNQVDQELIVSYGLPIKGVTYGIDVSANYRASNLKIKEKGYQFDLITPSGSYKGVYINLIGSHNISNALAAIAMADQAGIDIYGIIQALRSFPGVYRRMNVYEWNNSVVIDDYAHHPTEIQSVFETLKCFYPFQKNCVVFQPHLFSRTRDFMKEFSSVLSQFDEVVLMDIYPAREKPIKGINSQILLECITHKNKKIIHKTKIKSILETSEASVFALLGAGDIGVEINKLKPEFKSI